MTEARFAEFPEHADVPIERPIFVVGLPRTGTTALHRLLCADPGHQGLELWLTEFPQPRPPRETWEDDPIFNAMQERVPAASRQQPRVHGDPLHGCHLPRGVLATPAPDRQVDLLRVAGQRAALLRVARRPGLDRRLRAAPQEPAADRPARPGEALGAQEPVAPGRARRADEGLPRRADRLHPPRSRDLDRLRVLAVGRGDGRYVDDVRRRDDRPHPARDARTVLAAVHRGARGTTPPSSSTSTTRRS